MTTTSTDPYPDVAPPAGARFVDDWGTAGDGRRVILGVDHPITDSDMKVSTSCIQHSDGHIDDGSTSEAPALHIEQPVDLNSDQTRELGALLLELAAEMDGWVNR